MLKIGFSLLGCSLACASFKSSDKPLTNKIQVGILGATGTVGQRLISLLHNHPIFDLTYLAASERSQGKPYAQACNWILSQDIPKKYQNEIVQKCEVNSVPPNVSVIFSALDANVAGEIEQKLADQGLKVFSNAKNHRWDEFVPILVPGVNNEHLDLVKQQQSYKKSKGFIVTKSNCSTCGFVIPLKPLMKHFREQKQIQIKRISVATLQALSGAGYPGVPSMAIQDNVICHIDGEEWKLEKEPQKILGEYLSDQQKIKMKDLQITAQCNRVPITDGHTLCIEINVDKSANLDVNDFYEAWEQNNGEFTSAGLLKDNTPFMKVVKERPPQPRLDREGGEGMTTTVGFVRKVELEDCNVFKFISVSHNTIMGAAGGNILNAELAFIKGYLDN